MQHTHRDERDRKIGRWRSIHGGGPSRGRAINDSARSKRSAIVGQRRRRCIQGHALGYRRTIRKHGVHHVSRRRHKFLLVIQPALFLAISFTVCIFRETQQRVIPWLTRYICSETTAVRTRFWRCKDKILKQKSKGDQNMNLKYFQLYFNT